MYAPLRSHIEQHMALAEADWEGLIPLLRTRIYLKRQYLLQAGDVCTHESFIVKGCMRAFMINEKGQETVLQFGLENWWIADLNSFLTGTPAHFHVEALEDTTVVQISRTDLELLYSTHPVYNTYFRILFQRGFAAAQQRLIRTITQSAEERYSDFVQQYPSLSQRIPQKQIAAYLGITPEHLSKIRKDLKDLS